MDGASRHELHNCTAGSDGQGGAGAEGQRYIGTDTVRMATPLPSLRRAQALGSGLYTKTMTYNTMVIVCHSLWLYKRRANEMGFAKPRRHHFFFTVPRPSPLLQSVAVEGGGPSSSATTAVCAQTFYRQYTVTDTTTAAALEIDGPV